MRERREEDRLRALFESVPDALSAGAPLPHVAFGWLHEVLRSEFGEAAADFAALARAQAALATEAEEIAARRGSARSAPDAAAQASDHDAAAWRREWMRRWRRLRLPDRLHAFHDELGRARTPEQVYGALTEHAVRIVDGYTCVLFPPRTGAERLHPVPNPRLGLDPGRLSLPATVPLPRAERIAAADAAPAAPFVGLAALFEEAHAASLAHAPFGEGGAVLLIERRQGRVFEPEDWALLRALAAQAEAALERVRLLGRIEVFAHADPETGLAGGTHAPAALAHAWEMAERGEPLSVVVLQFAPGGADTGSDAEARLADGVRAFAAVLRDEAGEHGLAVRHSQERFLLILPYADAAAARTVVERVRRRAGGAVRASVVGHEAGTSRSPTELIERATALLDATSTAGL